MANALQRMAEAIRNYRASDKDDKKAGAEAINTALPEEVSGRPAVLKRRQRLADMDAQTADEPSPAQRAAMAKALRGEQ